MKTLPNLFGLALADHFHGRSRGPFLVCDERGEYPLDLSFYFTAEPTALEAEALTYAHGCIIDVGCGPGRILKYLQSCGRDVIGFDIDPIAIQLCEERGVSNAVVDSYHNLNRFAPADTILWLNRTLCTAGTVFQIQSLLESSWMVCSKGGILIFDSVEVRADLANQGEGILQNTLHFRYGDMVGQPFLRTYFSSSIAEAMLQKIGWELFKTIREGDSYIIVSGKNEQERTNHFSRPHTSAAE